jgi:hypothetical protein
MQDDEIDVTATGLALQVQPPLTWREDRGEREGGESSVHWLVLRAERASNV